MRRHPTLSGRLSIYFLTVMLVPFVIFISFYLISGERTLQRVLDEQAELLIETDAQHIEDIAEEYRHKSYLVSTNENVRKALASGVQPQGDEARAIYSALYSIMSGDTYRASLALVSSDGAVRISTHTFPEKYDIRTHSNVWDETNVLSIAERSAYKDKQWFISIADHRTENGRQIAFTVLRRIGDLGFAIIDVYTEAVTEMLEGGGFFSDMVLLDGEVYQAYSLLHTQSYGPFSSFPSLQETENLAVRPIAGTDLVLAGIVNTGTAENSLKTTMLYLFLSLAAGIAVSLLLTLIFSRSISRRFSMISSGMKRFERGDFTTKLEETGIYEFDRLSIAFNIMVRRIETLVARQREEEAKAAEAERKALESQLNPHFLFNTLSTIKALARLHGENEIYTIAVKLGKLLRYSIDNHASDATIKESLELAESYLMIQKIRFGERMNYTITCPEELYEAIVPRLMIQPLAENAVQHGLEGKTGDWRLVISVSRENDRLCVSVVDNGVGFDPPSDLAQLEKQGHTGLYNIKRRLELRYGDSFSFSVRSEKGKGTEVTIRLPYSMEDK